MKKIGEIKGIPVVEGNINEVNKNQIHYKENNGNIQLSKRGDDNKLNSVTGSSSGGGSKMEYYKLNLDKYGAMGNDAPFGGIFYVALGYPSLLRLKHGDYQGIAPNTLFGNNPTNVGEFISNGYDAIAFDPNIKIVVNVPEALQIDTENVWDYIQHWISLGAYHADDALIPITEEEFYNLN